MSIHLFCLFHSCSVSLLSFLFFLIFDPFPRLPSSLYSLPVSHITQGRSSGEVVFAAGAIQTAAGFIWKFNTSLLWNPSRLFLWSHREDECWEAEGWLLVWESSCLYVDINTTGKWDPCQTDFNMNKPFNTCPNCWDYVWQWSQVEGHVALLQPSTHRHRHFFSWGKAEPSSFGIRMDWTPPADVLEDPPHNRTLFHGLKKPVCIFY